MHRVLPAVGEIGRGATDPDEVVVHPQARDHLQQAQRLLALAPAVEHHRHRADVHAVGRLEQQVRRHAVQLDEHHADPRRARRHVDVEQPLDRHAVDELVRERRRIVHAGDVRAALHVRELLARLLHAGVEVTDHGLDAHDLFGVELHHDPQHTVRRRVLRAHVDDHRVAELVAGPGTTGQHQLARASAQDAPMQSCEPAARTPASIHSTGSTPAVRRSCSLLSGTFIRAL